MIRTWVAAAAILAMMSGVALAQGASSSTTSTWSSTTGAAPAPSSSSTRTERYTDRNGVETDHTRTSTTGPTADRGGDGVTVEKSTKTTTVR